MPVSAIGALTPLSSAWTHQMLVNTVRAVLNELDNEKIDNMNIRNYINIGLGNIAEMLNIAQKPWYNITWQLALEGSAHMSGLQWVNLATPVTPTAGTLPTRAPQPIPTLATVVPSNLLHRVRRITAPVGLAATVWQGSGVERSIEQLATLSVGLNDQHRHSIAWVHDGSGIYFFIGTRIGVDKDYTLPESFILWGTRKPMLDNLLAENNANSSWLQLVDMPDEHMRLLLLLAQKMCLEQRDKVPDQDTMNEISALTQQITGNLVAEVQHEKMNREKTKYGLTGR